MKKIFSIILLSIVLSSCSKSSPTEVTPDCNCDKVVEVATFNVVGTPQQPALQYHSVYTTINECTHIQKSKTYDTTDATLIPTKGQCR